MRAVVQRVSAARVEANGKVVGQVNTGMLALVGIAAGDGVKEIEWMAQKLATLRIFEDTDGKMNLALGEVDGGLLLVSNFTVCGDAQKGRRPSFTAAAPFADGEIVFNELVRTIQSHGVKVQTGEYGAEMSVHIVNDGPVTIVLDTP